MLLEKLFFEENMSGELIETLNLKGNKNNGVYIPDGYVAVINSENIITEPGFYFSCPEEDTKITMLMSNIRRHEKAPVSVQFDGKYILGLMYFTWEIFDIKKLFENFEGEISIQNIFEKLQEFSKMFIEDSYMEDTKELEELFEEQLGFFCEAYGIHISEVSFILNTIAVSSDESKNEENRQTDNTDDIDDMMDNMSSILNTSENKCRLCGWVAPDGINPKFCPECGSKWDV